jgi:hypothetical protein
MYACLRLLCSSVSAKSLSKSIKNDPVLLTDLVTKWICFVYNYIKEYHIDEVVEEYDELQKRVANVSLKIETNKTELKNKTQERIWAKAMDAISQYIILDKEIFNSMNYGLVDRAMEKMVEFRKTWDPIERNFLDNYAF